MSCSCNKCNQCKDLGIKLSELPVATWATWIIPVLIDWCYHQLDLSTIGWDWSLDELNVSWNWQIDWDLTIWDDLFVSDNLTVNWQSTFADVEINWDLVVTWDVDFPDWAICDEVLWCVENNANLISAIQDIPWFWWTTSTFWCSDVADCVENNVDVQDAIKDFIEDSDFTLSGDWTFEWDVDLSGATVTWLTSTWWWAETWVVNLPIDDDWAPNVVVPHNCSWVPSKITIYPSLNNAFYTTVTVWTPTWGFYTWTDNRWGNTPSTWFAWWWDRMFWTITNPTASNFTLVNSVSGSFTTSDLDFYYVVEC